MFNAVAGEPLVEVWPSKGSLASIVCSIAEERTRDITLLIPAFYSEHPPVSCSTHFELFGCPCKFPNDVNLVTHAPAMCHP